MSETFLIDEQIPGLAEDLLAFGPTVLVPGRDITNTMLRELNVTALFIRSTTRVDRELLEGTSVSFVGTATAGVDHVDVNALRDLGVRFVSAPGSNAWAVAEYVIATLLDLGVPRGTVIGIVGLGNVGSRLARAARYFGYTVYVNDPPLEVRGGLHDGNIYRVVDLQTLCTNSDVITVHVPLVSTGPFPTHHLISEAHLHSMKHGAVVINAARGGVIDERALVELHLAGKLTAVLDVFENEPHLERRTIESVERVTPHIAGYSLNAKREGARMVREGFMGPGDMRPGDMRPEDMRPGDMRPGDMRPEDVGPEDLREKLRVCAREFRDAWLKDPTPATFDRMRRDYPLSEEVLSTWAIFADGQ